MTEKRCERNQQNAQKLTDAIIWMFKNQAKWHEIYFGVSPEENTTTFSDAIMDELKMEGLMELYLINLCKIRDLLNIHENEKFLLLIEAGVDDDLPIDLEMIKKEILNEG